MGKIVRYEKIRRDLIEKIRSGEYAPGARVPSEKELIHSYGVSRITAAKALSLLRDEGYVSRLQGKGTYVAPAGDWPERDLPSPSPAGEGQKAPRRIGVMLPQLADLHGLEIARGITDTLRLPDYLVQLAVTHSQKNEDAMLRWYREAGFDGLIIFPADSEVYNEAILSMQLERFPFVLIDRFFPGINCSYVTADNQLGARCAAEHLLALGHEEIAFCASSPLSEQATAARYGGYVDALRGHGLLPRDCIRLTAASPERTRFARDVSAGKVTAAIAANACTAVEILSVCREAGRRVPEDFSIVSFDRAALLPEEAGYFSHLDQQSYQMGAQAAGLLHGRMEQPRCASTPSQIVLKPRLVSGQSTAPRKKAESCQKS